jgi:lipase chaperone LimK
MPYSYDEILSAQNDRINAEQAAATAELESARLNNDAYSVNAAANRILELDVQRNALAARANQYVARQQQSHGNRYGLSQDERDVARGSFGDSMTTEEKERLYAANKQRYEAARMTGAYRDDNGTVRR